MKGLSTIKAVIFDWAGTIVDYGCMAPASVFVKVFENHGVKVSMEEARGPMGLAKKDHVRVLVGLDNVKRQWKEIQNRDIGEDDVDRIYGELEPTLAEVVGEYAEPVPGIIQLFRILRENGIKIGSTTGYVQEMMKNVVPLAIQNGVNPDAIVTSSEVDQGRPHPWMCYLNAIRLEVYPFSAMVKIGDTVADIREGLNAGMWTIGFSKSGNEVGLSLEETERTDPILLNEKIKSAEAKLKEAGAHYVVEGPWNCLHTLEEISMRIENGDRP
jgi:phosphonoacetaldehyde hydrolase